MVSPSFAVVAMAVALIYIPIEEIHPLKGFVGLKTNAEINECRPEIIIDSDEYRLYLSNILIPALKAFKHNMKPQTLV